MVQFFIPEVDVDRQEDVYAALLHGAGSTPDISSRRIYSMTWSHHEVEITATVGESLLVREAVSAERKVKKRLERIPRLWEDRVSAILLAVGLGIVFHEVTNGIWQRLMLTGVPSIIVYFES